MKQIIKRKRKPIVQRLLSRTHVPINTDGTNNTDDCWTWQGVTNNAGYGLIKVDSEINMATVHRVMMIEHNKTIKYGDKIEVLHECGNKLCVNPHHLKLGNIVDRTALQRKHKAWNPYFNDKSKMYLTCEHCGRTNYLPHFKRLHSLCEYNAKHKYITQSISGKLDNANKRIDET